MGEISRSSCPAGLVPCDSTPANILAPSNTSFPANKYQHLQWRSIVLTSSYRRMFVVLVFRSCPSSNPLQIRSPSLTLPPFSYRPFSLTLFSFLEPIMKKPIIGFSSRSAVSLCLFVWSTSTGCRRVAGWMNAATPLFPHIGQSSGKVQVSIQHAQVPVLSHREFDRGSSSEQKVIVDPVDVTVYPSNILCLPSHPPTLSSYHQSCPPHLVLPFPSFLRPSSIRCR